MRQVELIPSDIGQPGGKETRQRVSHYIEPSGVFARACATLIAEQGAIVACIELWAEGEDEKRKRKAASKTKYACPGCDAAHLRRVRGGDAGRGRGGRRRVKHQATPLAY